MSEWPIQTTAATPTHISTSSILSGVYDAQALAESATIASMSSFGEKVAAFIPVFLPWPYPVQRVFWMNGSAAGGNVDFGLYTKDAKLILSAGSTLATGNSEIQYVDVTDKLLPAGLYYFALVNDSATTANRFFGATGVTAIQGRLGGLAQMAAAFALPATATLAAWAGTGAPYCGITKTAAGL